VPAEIRGLQRHHDDMAESGRDVAVTARAEVPLHGLVRLEEADLELAQGGRILHARSAQEGPEHEQDGHQDPRAHEEVVGRTATLLAVRIETHGPRIGRRTRGGARLGPVRPPG
jgi:hypothetical protein